MPSKKCVYGVAATVVPARLDRPSIQDLDYLRGKESRTAFVTRAIVELLAKEAGRLPVERPVSEAAEPSPWTTSRSNQYTVDGDVVRIRVLRTARGGKPEEHVVLVDEADFHLVQNDRWYIAPEGYAFRGGTAQYSDPTKLMHRVLAGVDKGVQIRHVNGDKLDNRRENLRVLRARG
jgi:hypothetical protein